jgi:hypothetical protein
LPEFFEAVRAGKAAGSADDRDRLQLVPFHCERCNAARAHEHID